MFECLPGAISRATSKRTRVRRARRAAQVGPVGATRASQQFSMCATICHRRGTIPYTWEGRGISLGRMGFGPSGLSLCPSRSTRVTFPSRGRIHLPSRNLHGPIRRNNFQTVVLVPTICRPFALVPKFTRRHFPHPTTLRHFLQAPNIIYRHFAQAPNRICKPFAQMPSSIPKPFAFNSLHKHFALKRAFSVRIR